MWWSISDHVICQVLELLAALHKVPRLSVAFSLWWKHNQDERQPITLIICKPHRHCFNGLTWLWEGATGTSLVSVDLKPCLTQVSIVAFAELSPSAKTQIEWQLVRFCAVCSHFRWPWKHAWYHSKSQSHNCPCERYKILVLLSSANHKQALSCHLLLKEQPGGVARRPQL